jgi:phosphotriesterase-related protein
MTVTGEHRADRATVNTVLGPVAAADLGIVLVGERLLSVFPGAQYAYDLTIDRAEIFETLSEKLTRYRRAGGGTVIDSTGMFHGRDLTLLETLSRSTGVHIVGSTGMGPEAMLGGYFLTPQTNPPAPWPADKFAELFAAEITEGMVVPRLERRGSAGVVATTATTEGMTAVDESLFRGAARAASATGVPVSIRFGADAIHDLEVILDEQLPADRVVVGGLDRRDAAGADSALEVARRGAYAAIDHVGSADEIHVSDGQRAALIAELVAAGHRDRILLSSAAIGHAVGESPSELPYDYVLADFVALLRGQGISEDDVRRVLVDNPRNLLAVREAPGAGEAPNAG